MTSDLGFRLKATRDRRVLDEETGRRRAPARPGEGTQGLSPFTSYRDFDDTGAAKPARGNEDVRRPRCRNETFREDERCRARATGFRAATSWWRLPPFHLRLADGTEYSASGTLNFVDTAVDPKSGTVQIRVQVPNHDRFLRAGQLVRVGVAAEPVVGLEERDVVRALEEVGGGETGDAGTDHRRGGPPTVRGHRPLSLTGRCRG